MTVRRPSGKGVQGIPSRVRVKPQEIERATPASVSVVIPCFNYGRYLRGCVQSALIQRDVCTEVIIVDDASTDDSLEVAHELARTERRVRVLANDTNQGPVATYNRGLALAGGEFSVRLDADDMLAPGALARAVALFDVFPTVGLVYGHPLHFEGVPPKTVDRVRAWTVWPGAWWVRRRCQRGVNCITSPEVVMRQSVVREVGGQRNLAQAHDMEMWMRIAAVSDVGHLDGADQALHREHPQSRSAQMLDVPTDLIERRLAFRLLFGTVGGQLPGAEHMEELAYRALAAEALSRACSAYDRGRVDLGARDWLQSFAIETYAGAENLSQWRALHRRERVGPVAARLMPPFIVALASRRIISKVSYWAWTRSGI